MFCGRWAAIASRRGREHRERRRSLAPGLCGARPEVVRQSSLWDASGMAKDNTDPIAELLALAASTVIPAPDRKPWTYGWANEGYRRSESAALDSSHGPVTVTSEGMAAFEEAVAELLNDNQIRARWHTEEFWVVVAAGVVAASEIAAEGRLDHLKRRIIHWRDGGKALTLQLVANVTWERSPLLLGNSVIGNANDEFLTFVNTMAHGRPRVRRTFGERWMENQIQPRESSSSSPPVAIACWTVGQWVKAFRETDRQFRNIVDLSLLLERDLAAHEVYRRGDVNRPGIRGMTLDRGAIERNLPDPASLELGAIQWTTTNAEDMREAHWFSAEPLPLGDLLTQDYLREAVKSCLKDDPISNRIRVAARWFAEAHYAGADDDAALALGVAIDALLTGKNNLSGSAMADRVAMLEADPAKRPERVAAYLAFYKVRSSVAHSGRSSKLDDSAFVDEYRAFVHWTAWRSLALRDEFAISSEAAVDQLYNNLRWGLESWAT
jgi:hypothetical protein